MYYRWIQVQFLKTGKVCIIGYNFRKIAPGNIRDIEFIGAQDIQDTFIMQIDPDKHRAFLGGGQGNRTTK
jgi:hypothetical protein